MNEIKTKVLKATYQSMRAFSHMPSSNWLSISEFIDNSISSFLGKNTSESLNGLIINITYDLTDSDSKKLIIEDNARGMEPEILLDAMQPYNHSQKGRSKEYNQYGVGMKFGCFYNGEDAYIYSKTKGNNEYFVEFKTSDKEDGEAITLSVVESFDNKIKSTSGTTIIIDKLYKSRSAVKDDELDELLEALSWRYGKLIIDRGLKIILRRINERDDDFIKYEKNVSGFIQSSLKFDDFIEFNGFKGEEKERVIKFCKDAITMVKNSNQDNALLSLFCNKYLNNEIMEIELLINVNNESKTYTVAEEHNKKLYYIPKDINDMNLKLQSKEYNVVLKFGVLKCKRGEYSKYHGVTTYHIDRAINHGPNNRKSAKDSKSIPFKDVQAGSGGDQTWRRLWGEVNLTEIEVPDTNKYRFNWSPNGYNDLARALNDIYKDMKPLLSQMVRCEDENVRNEKSSNNELNEVVKIQKSERILDPNLIDGDVKEDFVIYTINNCKHTIKIQESKQGPGSNFLYINDNETNCTTAIVNIDSNLWKPFIYDTDDDRKTRFRARTVYKLVLTLVFANNKELLENVIESNKSNITTISSSNLKDKNYELVRVIGDVLKLLECKE
ncbi:ATP-binding protein [Malacoplasma iowae]|uniref:ATP-binding protein n=1 Tax=Malacoplasma iowae TaxID=2116 RepID=UPI002A188A87|nr:ATP-binding protein [Malacoplasma iowae]WPL40374.1 ATP-binding protein [Malacoplasma iowae]